MWEKDVRLSDLTPAGCLLALSTAAVVFAGVMCTLKYLPAEWIKFVPKAAVGLLAASVVGIPVFYAGNTALGLCGVRVFRRRGEIKVVEITFGVLVVVQFADWS